MEGRKRSGRRQSSMDSDVTTSPEISQSDSEKNEENSFPLPNPQEKSVFNPTGIASVVVGIFVGALMCFSNMYFGLQTGWVTMGSLQSTLLGFGIFKALSRGRNDNIFGRFGPLDNVLLQTTAVATATMPLAGGFVGILPALGMLDEKEDGISPIKLNFFQMILWSVALCFFGVFFAVPLRKQAILKEKLKFPSGTATAQMIQVLHKLPPIPTEEEEDNRSEMQPINQADDSDDDFIDEALLLQQKETEMREWKKKWKILGISFGVSAFYTFMGHFYPVLKNLPVGNWIGLGVLTQWYWVLTPSLSYVGQGMIMGIHTNLSMLAGTVLGWAILGPIAKSNGWAPNENIGSWKNGAKGWILWISLSIMMAESIVSLAVMVGKIIHGIVKNRQETIYDPSSENQRVARKVWVGGLIISSLLCVIIVSPMFKMPIWEPFLAVLMALVVSVLAVRALGETDLNPVSGVGKVSQIFFALIAPGKVVPNIVAGAIAEAGAQQAGDLMQDLKTGHLLRASPKAQFYGQMIGSFFSVIFAVAAYELYTKAYSIPGPQFPVPTAQIWLDMARVLNGGHLATNVLPFCIFFAIFGGILPLFELFHFGKSSKYSKFLPSGIAFAIGMYVTPNWTIPRVIGSVSQTLWKKYGYDSHESYMIILASGFVLGEGITSIFTAMLTSFGVEGNNVGCSKPFC